MTVMNMDVVLWKGGQLGAILHLSSTVRCSCGKGGNIYIYIYIYIDIYIYIYIVVF